MVVRNKANKRSLRRVSSVMKAMEGMQNIGRLETIVKSTQAMVGDAIPLEQLKGDIARAGHPIKQALALDAQGRRIFFTDVKGEHLYADFDTADNGFRVKHIGHQASIIKEYDVQDPEISGLAEVHTVHEEEDFVDTPGLYPGETYTVKPEEDDRGFGAESQVEAVKRKALLDEMACK